MRILLRWAPLVCLAAGMVPTPEARAYLGHGRTETVYVAPVETVLSVPTTYVSPTSYLLPTAYVSPTVYTTSYVPTTYYLSPTAYVIPTYRATSYLRPRRVVERPIVTTTRVYDYDLRPSTYYYTPTTLDLPVVSSYEGAVRDGGDLFNRDPFDRGAGPQGPAPAASPSTVAPRQAPRAVISVPKEEPPLQTEAKPEPETEILPPPAEPAPAKPEDNTPTPPPVPADVPFPDIPPVDGDPQPPDAPPRESLKPAALSGGILEGRVVSGTTGQAERNVKVVISNRRSPEAFVNREATTDALGRYAIDLPPGDWAVKVIRPNGKTYSVKNVTVSAGRVTADDGQAVPSLVINL